MLAGNSNFECFTLEIQGSYFVIIVYLENAWDLFSMITEGATANLLETTQRAFCDQSQSEQRSTLRCLFSYSSYIFKQFLWKLDLKQIWVYFITCSDGRNGGRSIIFLRWKATGPVLIQALPSVCATESVLKQNPVLSWKCCLHSYILVHQIW